MPIHICNNIPIKSNIWLAPPNQTICPFCGEKMNTQRHGSPTFYNLLDEMANTHEKKSHDYASNENPYGNYHFAGKLALLFSHSEQDAGFVGRIGEKLYRLANLESSQKDPSNESIEDTERDICVITALWMANRRDRRRGAVNEQAMPREDTNNTNTNQHALARIINEIPNLTETDTRQVADYFRRLVSDLDHAKINQAKR